MPSARTSSGRALAEVPRSALAALDKSPAELRDRTVLHVKPEDVTASSASGPARPPLIAASASGPPTAVSRRWRLRSPTEGAADPFKASSLLYGLTSLRAEPTERSLPTDDEDAPASGPPHAPSPSRGQDGKALGTIVIGAASAKPAGTFVRDDRGRVVVVDSARLKEIPTTPADLLPPPRPPALPGVDAGS